MLGHAPTTRAGLRYRASLYNYPRIAGYRQHLLVLLVRRTIFTVAAGETPEARRRTNAPNLLLLSSADGAAAPACLLPRVPSTLAPGIPGHSPTPRLLRFLAAFFLVVRAPSQAQDISLHSFTSSCSITGRTSGLASTEWATTLEHQDGWHHGDRGGTEPYFPLTGIARFHTPLGNGVILCLPSPRGNGSLGSAISGDNGSNSVVPDVGFTGRSPCIWVTTVRVISPVLVPFTEVKQRRARQYLDGRPPGSTGYRWQRRAVPLPTAGRGGTGLARAGNCTVGASPLSGHRSFFTLFLLPSGPLWPRKGGYRSTRRLGHATF